MYKLGDSNVIGIYCFYLKEQMYAE